MMFLLVGGMYYNTSNARIVGVNYLELCGLRFPLVKGCSLEDEEERYMKKNGKALEEFREDLERKISKGGEFVREIEDDIQKKKDVLFFLEEVCSKNARETITSQGSETVKISPFYTGNIEAIYPKIITKDYASINGRLYPLVGSEKPVFVSLDGRNYSLSAGELTADKINSSFKLMLEQKLRLEVMKKCSTVQELEKERQHLSDEILKYMSSLNISVYAHALEWSNGVGIIGFDVTGRLLYHLIAPHYNYTTSKNYSEGQSAATLPLDKRAIGTTWKFAERDNRNSKLVVSSASHCLGDLKIVGNTVEDKLVFLKEFAHEVEINQAFYQISTSSDSSDDSGSYY